MHPAIRVLAMLAAVWVFVDLNGTASAFPAACGGASFNSFRQNIGIEFEIRRLVIE
jgi:hypothetical protein